MFHKFCFMFHTSKFTNTVQECTVNEKHDVNIEILIPSLATVLHGSLHQTSCFSSSTPSVMVPFNNVDHHFWGGRKNKPYNNTISQNKHVINQYL